MTGQTCPEHGLIYEGLQRIEKKIDNLEDKIVEMRSSMYGNGNMDKVKKSFAGQIQSCESRIALLEKSRSNFIEYMWRYLIGPVIALLAAAVFRVIGV